MFSSVLTGYDRRHPRFLAVSFFIPVVDFGRKVFIGAVFRVDRHFTQLLGRWNAVHVDGEVGRDSLLASPGPHPLNELYPCGRLEKDSGLLEDVLADVAILE